MVHADDTDESVLAREERLYLEKYQDPNYRTPTYAEDCKKWRAENERWNQIYGPALREKEHLRQKRRDEKKRLIADLRAGSVDPSDFPKIADFLSE